MSTGHCQKQKVKLQKKTRERHQNLSEEKKHVNMFLKGVKIFLKKKKAKNKNCRER